MHFLFFLTSIALYIFIGLAMGIHVHQMKRWKYNRARFLFTTTTAAFVGGLLAELSNGSPDYGISITNMFIAAFAAFLAISLAFPKYAKEFIEEIKYYEQIFASFIRTQIQTRKNK